MEVNMSKDTNWLEKNSKRKAQGKKGKKEEDTVIPWINTLRDEVLLYCYGGII